jgi:hypothetical protein
MVKMKAAQISEMVIPYHNPENTNYHMSALPRNPYCKAHHKHCNDIITSAKVGTKFIPSKQSKALALPSTVIQVNQQWSPSSQSAGPEVCLALEVQSSLMLLRSE